MPEQKYRGIGWRVSEAGQKFERILPGLGFFFREGESFPETPFMPYQDAVKLVIQRRNQLKNFGKAGTVVFDIQSDHSQFEEEF